MGFYPEAGEAVHGIDSKSFYGAAQASRRPASSSCCPALCPPLPCLPMVEARLQADRSRSTNLDESYRYALRLTRSTARNFAYSFWFLTPERRRSIAAVYAYSRRLDDCVDSAVEGSSDKETARRGLERLRRLLAGDQ